MTLCTLEETSSSRAHGRIRPEIFILMHDARRAHRFRGESSEQEGRRRKRAGDSATAQIGDKALFTRSHHVLVIVCLDVDANCSLWIFPSTLAAFSFNASQLVLRCFSSHYQERTYLDPDGWEVWLGSEASRLETTIASLSGGLGRCAGEFRRQDRFSCLVAYTTLGLRISSSFARSSIPQGLRNASQLVGSIRAYLVHRQHSGARTTRSYNERCHRQPLQTAGGKPASKVFENFDDLPVSNPDKVDPKARVSRQPSVKCGRPGPEMPGSDPDKSRVGEGLFRQQAFWSLVSGPRADCDSTQLVLNASDRGLQNLVLSPHIAMFRRCPGTRIHSTRSVAGGRAISVSKSFGSVLSCQIGLDLHNESGFSIFLVSLFNLDLRTFRNLLICLWATDPTSFVAIRPQEGSKKNGLSSRDFDGIDSTDQKPRENGEYFLTLDLHEIVRFVALPVGNWYQNKCRKTYLAGQYWQTNALLGSLQALREAGPSRPRAVIQWRSARFFMCLSSLFTDQTELVSGSVRISAQITILAQRVELLDVLSSEVVQCSSLQCILSLLESKALDSSGGVTPEFGLAMPLADR
ncbi:hypothetical protein R3P38DRAFT_3344515 [Favolaschia claudopus]|uniref:Uncharacterized protein n=1 Tax=Favolaschia claudopus TaxID=2862362 RepID=A0AAW0DJV9_9AGAR